MPHQPPARARWGDCSSSPLARGAARRSTSAEMASPTSYAVGSTSSAATLTDAAPSAGPEATREYQRSSSTKRSTALPRPSLSARSTSSLSCHGARRQRTFSATSQAGVLATAIAIPTPPTGAKTAATRERETFPPCSRAPCNASGLLISSSKTSCTSSATLSAPWSASTKRSSTISVLGLKRARLSDRSLSPQLRRYEGRGLRCSKSLPASSQCSRHR